MGKTREKVNNLFGEEVWASEKFADQDHPLDHWNGMPEFVPKSSNAEYTIRFEMEHSDVDSFEKLIGQKIGENTTSLWHPRLSSDDYSSIRYVSDRSVKNSPKYPIYIPSKGRWEKRLTSDTLIKMGVKHNIIIEESQYEQYKAHTDPEYVTLLILPQKYLDEYDTCDTLGSTRSKGPGPARNFAWDHAISQGHKRHWVSDDNVQNFYRMNGNKRVIVSDGAIFRAMEDHADQYENVYMSGPHYRFFAVPADRLPPFAMNTRIYSTNLILNSAPFRWRGRYNEDTILSLDMLKAGGVTLQYYAFLTGKVVTQALGGGNTAEFYAKEGTLPKSKMLEDVYPEYAKVVWKYGRWHHYVDYNSFKGNKLIPLKSTYYNDDFEYGMTFVEFKNGK